jgi:hypothetical protein
LLNLISLFMKHVDYKIWLRSSKVFRKFSKEDDATRVFRKLPNEEEDVSLQDFLETNPEKVGMISPTPKLAFQTMMFDVSKI